MKILFVAEAGESACREVRADIPAEGLLQHGHDVWVTPVMFENADGKLYGYDHIAEKQLPRPDVVIVRHTNGPDGEAWDSVDMYEQARQKGQRLFYDMDDDMWNIPDWNPASQWVTEDVQRLIVRNVNACDALIVSTDAIARSALEHGVNVPVHVIPNGVRINDYEPHPGERNPLRLAWFGATDWRSDDFDIVADALENVLAKRDDVQFWHIGWKPACDLSPWEFTFDIIEYPWVPLVDLPRVMRMIDCAIIPMRKHPFNDARSNHFGLKLSAAEVTWMASATPEYEKLWRTGAGYLVQDDWESALSVLIDPAYTPVREDVKHGGRLAVQQYTPEKIGRRYAELFQ